MRRRCDISVLGVLGLVISVGLLTVSTLWASVPEGFSVLANHSDIIVDEQNNPALQQVASSAWLPYAGDCSRGFAAYCVDTSVSPNPNWMWTDRFLSREIITFACRGQYKTSAVAIRTLQPVKGMQVQCSNLANGSAIILSENVDFRWVQYTHAQLSNPVAWEGKWIEKATAIDLPTLWTEWLWVTFYIPNGTASGTYTGQVTISDTDGNSLIMPVSLLVLDFDLQYPPFSYGMYLPGHAYFMPDKGSYVNYATETYWKAENLQQYFSYWKTRGLNSPTLYGVYPETLKCVDGHAVIDVPFVRAVAQAMNAVGLSGDLCIDTRWIEWWTKPVADEIQHRINAGQTIMGDLHIYGWQGYEGIMNYNSTCKRLYGEAIYNYGEEPFGILDYALTENWPRVRFAAEDEPTGSWDYPYKAYGYDTFTPVLVSIDPNIALIIDNGIGYYNAFPELDRGARDHLKLRQYNSWTEEALASVQVDNAETRGFNLGLTRSAIGQYQQRIGSTGYHQWADQWYGARESVPDYMYSRLTTQGVVGSVHMDRFREGIDDRAYCYTLEQLISQLGVAGQTQEAAIAQSVLDSFAADVPLRHFDYTGWAGAMTSKELDRRLWNIVNAIARARQVLGLSSQTYPTTISLGEQIPQRQGNVGSTMFTDILHDDMQNSVTNRGYYGCTMVADGDGFITVRADGTDATFGTSASSVNVAANDVFVYAFKAGSLPVGTAGISIGMQIDGVWYHSSTEPLCSDLNYHVVQWQIPASGSLMNINFDIKWSTSAQVSIYDYRIIRASVCNGASEEPLMGDMNGDQRVNLVDFAMLAQHWLEASIISTTNLCDSLAQFDNCSSMTLSVQSGGLFGNYIRAIPYVQGATVAWIPNGSAGVSISAGDTLSFSGKGYATDFQVTALINGTYHTLRAYSPLGIGWASFEYAIPVSGTLMRVEFTVYLQTEQCNLDNLKINHFLSSISPFTNDAWVDMLDLEVISSHWLECTRSDCQ